jgi:hypothetical protein
LRYSVITLRAKRLTKRPTGYCKLIDITAKIRDSADSKEFANLIRWDPPYHHTNRRGDDNGFSRMPAALFGPSIALPIEMAKFVGTWQYVISLARFDNRPRTREIALQLIGETE